MESIKRQMTPWLPSGMQVLENDAGGVHGTLLAARDHKHSETNPSGLLLALAGAQVLRNNAGGAHDMLLAARDHKELTRPAAFTVITPRCAGAGE